ncbi:GNAT family N-acetyltransferase [Candidatus Woesearchaeota archaeon]|nr:GNAT family N-acetyltransferase [Candidatus Woesearchaeota archaeon]MBW3005904.1 GNAT family N-acetyltransferase [Candidatus Woesearchaeota archaeon]
MTIIRTKEFILRPINLLDAEPYFEVMQDEETKKNLTSVPKNLSEAKQEIKGLIKQIKEKDSEIFTVEINGKYAGNVLLQHQNWNPASDEGRVHIWIHPDYRGKGLATKVLAVVVKYGLKNKFKRIFAQCKAHNKGVITVLKNLDFKKVKTHSVENSKKILWVKE